MPREDAVKSRWGPMNRHPVGMVCDAMLGLFMLGLLMDFYWFWPITHHPPSPPVPILLKLQALPSD